MYKQKIHTVLLIYLLWGNPLFELGGSELPPCKVRKRELEKGLAKAIYILLHSHKEIMMFLRFSVLFEFSM